MLNEKIKKTVIILVFCTSLASNLLAIGLCDEYPVAPCLRQILVDMYVDYANKNNFELALKRNDFNGVKMFINSGKIKVDREIINEVIFICSNEMKEYFLKNFSNETEIFHENLQNKLGDYNKHFRTYTDVELFLEDLYY
ncbi:MAG: hypothetical protein UR12_C0007G0001 [candidate division TM6 bacterium GW2011_GWF2_30_66]|jgi:hypothetical protein|nr:MAG: hypothetical protein UR12_C0007G0001 [candidate division TM6 bacterium GW2011_GWF2_30_66]